MAEKYANLLITDTTRNWNGSAMWFAADRVTPTTDPTSSDNTHLDNLTFLAAGQSVVVNSTASCLSMDWTGATNTPTLAFTTNKIKIYSSATFIVGMALSATSTGAYCLEFEGTGTFTTAGLNYPNGIHLDAAGGPNITLSGNLIITGTLFVVEAGTLTSGNNGITCKEWYSNYVSAKIITLGSSIVNCTSWGAESAHTTLTANTSTINVTGTGAFAGGDITTYNNINLNGTAHTVSGNFTCNVLTRNGTATKTDTLTLTSGTTVNCTTFAPKGNSVTNRLLVQSSTLGSPATITATNMTGWQNTDFMDYTATNAIDLSAGSSGDCGGNTGITFTPSAAQTWDGTTNNWSNPAHWTSRVPLPQDDVSAGGAGNTITVDMPRIGRSITHISTPTFVFSNDVSNYGSYIQAIGATYTMNGHTNFFRTRNASSNITIAGANSFTITLGISGTFNSLTVDRSAAAKTLVATGTTQTVNSFSCPVSGATVLTITGGTWKFDNNFSSIASDYLTVSGSTASPAKRWFAGAHGSDGGGNSGWVFGNPVSPSVFNLGQRLIGMEII